MMLYLASSTRPDIYFAVHRCDWFTHNTKESHEMAMKRICRYLQCTKDNVLMFNLYKKLVVNYFADADFSGLWGHENPQDPICDRSRTVFVATFANCTLFWVSKLYIDLICIHYIMSMWNCITLLENYLPCKVLSRK